MAGPRVVERYGIRSAAQAAGHVVVIDVLRAFTTAAYAFNAGADRIVLVGTAEEAFRLRADDPEVLLVGESGGRIVPGFDYGNSPEQMAALDLAGRTVVLRSSSGTQGVVQAVTAERVYLGSLVVAAATVRLLRAVAADPVTLLAMGSRNGPDKEEDLACQAYMSALLAGRSADHQALADAVAASPAGQMALDPAIDWKTPGDLACAIAIDRFDFTMPVTREAGLLVARAVPAPQTAGAARSGCSTGGDESAAIG